MTEIHTCSVYCTSTTCLCENIKVNAYCLRREREEIKRKTEREVEIDREREIKREVGGRGGKQ